MKKLSIFLVLATFLFTCKEEDTLLNDQLIGIKGISDQPIFTEPYNHIALTVTIHPDAASAYRRIVLRSEGGTFSPDSLILSKASNNEASATFRPGSTPGNFEIRASVQGKPEFYVIRHITLRKQSSSEILAIEGLDEVSYPTDAFNKVRFKIERLVKTNADYKRIKLESDGGTFSPSTVVLEEDQDEADIHFIPGLTPGEFSIKASFENNPEVFVTKKIVLESQPLTEVIDVQLTTDSAKADGQSILEGRVLLKNTLEKTVTLRTTDPEGRFIPENTQEITMEANDLKEIPFQIVTSTAPGQYFVQAALKDVRNLVAQTSYELFPLRSDEVLSLSFEQDSVLADGTTSVVGRGSVSNYENAKIILETNQGAFLGSAQPLQFPIEPDPAGNFGFRFIPSTSVTNQIITATIEGTSFSITKELPSKRSYPENIYIEPSMFEIDSASGSITLKVVLMRARGKVSERTRVSFDAKQLQGGQLVDVGSFKNLPAYSQDGLVTVQFALDTRKAFTASPITISATVSNEDTTVVTETIEIIVISND